MRAVQPGHVPAGLRVDRLRGVPVRVLLSRLRLDLADAVPRCACCRVALCRARLAFIPALHAWLSSLLSDVHASHRPRTAGGTWSNATGISSELSCVSVVADEWAPTGSRFPEPCPASGFTCPGRAGDTVNEVPGSKPIVVDSGQASEDQEVETITFGVVVDTTPEEYDEEAYIQMLAEHYGVDASLISVEATPVDDHRRRQLSHGGGGGLNLQVTIRVPDEETYSYEPPEQDGEEWQPDVVDTESGLTVGGTDGGGGGVVGPVLIAPSPPPRPSTAARLASRLAAIDTSGEGLAEAFTALGVNVTQATDLAITTVTVQVSVECPVRRAKLESSTTVADTPDLLLTLSRLSPRHRWGTGAPPQIALRARRARTTTSPTRSTRARACSARSCPPRPRPPSPSPRACATRTTTTPQPPRWTSSACPAR